MLYLQERVKGTDIPLKHGSRVVVKSVPGEKYNLIDPVTGKTPKGLTAKRIDNDLHLRSEIDDTEVILEDFWGECEAGNQCFAILDTPEVAGGELTGQTIITQVGENIELLAGQIGQLGAATVVGALGAVPVGLWALVGLGGAALLAGAGGSSGGSEVPSSDNPVQNNTPSKNNTTTQGDTTPSTPSDNPANTPAQAPDINEGSTPGSVDISLPSDDDTVEVKFTDEDGNSHTITATKNDDGSWTLTDPDDTGAKIDEDADGNPLINIPANSVKDDSDVTATGKADGKDDAQTTGKAGNDEDATAPTITPNDDGSVGVSLPSDDDTVEVKFTDEDGNSHTITATKNDDGSWTLTDPDNTGAKIGEDADGNPLIDIPADSVKDGSDVTATGKAEDKNDAPADGKTAASDNITADDITINPIATDNIIDNDERQSNITITGKVNNGNTGDTVTLTDANGKELGTGTLKDDGTFEIPVSGQDLVDVATDSGDKSRITAKVTSSIDQKESEPKQSDEYTLMRPEKFEITALKDENGNSLTKGSDGKYSIPNSSTPITIEGKVAEGDKGIPKAGDQLIVDIDSGIPNNTAFTATIAEDGTFKTDDAIPVDRFKQDGDKQLEIYKGDGNGIPVGPDGNPVPSNQAGYVDQGYALVTQPWAMTDTPVTPPVTPTDPTAPTITSVNDNSSVVMLNDEHQPITDTIPVVVKVPTDVQDGDVLVVNGVETLLTKADADKEIIVDVPRDSDQNKDKPNDEFDVVASIKRGDKESPKAEASQPYDTDGDGVNDATDTDDDGDGVNDADEGVVVTDPKLYDTDPTDDKLSDGEIDTDGDGKPNAYESDVDSDKITDLDNDGTADLNQNDKPIITPRPDGGVTVEVGNNSWVEINYYPESTATGAEHGQEVGTNPSATAADSPETLTVLRHYDDSSKEFVYTFEEGTVVPEGVTLDSKTGTVTFEPNSILGGTEITAGIKLNAHIEVGKTTEKVGIDTAAENEWYLFSASEVKDVQNGNSEWLKEYFIDGQGKNFTGDNGDIIVSGVRDFTETLIISIENGETLTLKPFKPSDHPNELSNIHTRWLVVDENGNIDVAKTQQYIKDAPGSTTNPSIHNRFILKGENLANGQKVSAWATNDLGLDKPANEGNWSNADSYTVTADKNNDSGSDSDSNSDSNTVPAISFTTNKVTSPDGFIYHNVSNSDKKAGKLVPNVYDAPQDSHDIWNLIPNDGSSANGLNYAGTVINTGNGDDVINVHNSKGGDGLIGYVASVGGKTGTGSPIQVDMGDGDDQLTALGVHTKSGINPPSKVDGASIFNAQINMGDGDDIVTIGGTISHTLSDNETVVDGGAGFDTLNLNGSNVSQTMLSIDGNDNVTNHNYIKGFEVINLNGNTLNNLYFSAVQNNGAEEALRINGSGTVQLGTNGGDANSQSDTTGGDWINQGTETIDGVSYVRWHNSAATDDSLDVLIQSGIQVL